MRYPSRSLRYSELKALEEQRYLDFEYFKWKNKKTDTFYADVIPFYPASDIERIIFNYLFKLGINFQFQYRLANWPETFFPESIWTPDFVLPDYNIIIEAYGYYWHSIPQRRDFDQIKKLYFLTLGYAVIENGIAQYPTDTNWHGGKLIIWWDYEIYTDIQAIINRDCPEIMFRRAIPELPQVPEIKRLEAIQKAERLQASLITKKIVPKFKPLKPLTFKLRKYERRAHEVPPNI